jgi:hypothetical protein
MTSPFRPALVVGLLIFAPMAKAGTVEVTQSAQQRLDLHTVALAAASRPVQLPATMDVLDPAPLARLAEDIAVAEAAASTSAAEARRSEILFHADANVAAKVVEAARGQATIDAARVRQLRTDLTLTWGARLGRLEVATLRRTLVPYVNGERVLLRAQYLQDVRTTPTGASVDVTGNPPVEATVLGRLPQSTTGLNPEWLLAASGADLVAGMHAVGYLRVASDRVAGLLLPREAIVRWNGLAWTYVQVDPTHFERRPVEPAQRLDDGWLVGSSVALRPGERVVVAGASALLAIEAGTPAAD